MHREANEIKANSPGRLVNPPMIDLLYREDEAQAFIVAFVPSDAVSNQPTETVQISVDSTEGRQISAWLSKLPEVLGRQGRVKRIVHRGGGDFAFVFDDGASLPLSENRLSPASVQRTYDGLQYVSQSAELAFQLQRAAAHAAPK